MKTKFKDRFGNEVEFERKEKVFTGCRRGERFELALVRCFYPAEWRRMKKQYPEQFKKIYGDKI